jgi:4-amino-4-deoxy-L-arabinose transferase-like glycosyltransferase
MTTASTHSLDAPRSIAVTWRRWLMHPAFIPACFIGGLLLRLAVVLLFPVEPMSDSAWYVARARGLVAGLGYREGDHPTAYWPVGWPAILAGALAVFGSVAVSVAFLNLAAVALIMSMILWLGRNIAGSETVARMALVAYALYPNHIAYTGVAATETVYTALALAAFALLYSGRRSAPMLILCGLIFGVATLVKPQTIAFPFGAVIALGLVIRDYRWKSALRAGLIVYAALLCVVLPWSFRNHAVFGEFVLVSTNGGTALLLGANDQATGGHFDYQHTPVFTNLGIPWEERVARQVELNQRQKQVANAWIRDNLLLYLSWMPKKVIKLWIKDTDGFWSFDHSYPQSTAIVRFAQYVNQTFYTLVLALALACAIVALRSMLMRREDTIRLALLFCMPVFVSLLAAAFTGQIRYHFPAMPFLLVAAAWTLIHAGSVWPRRRNRPRRNP